MNAKTNSMRRRNAGYSVTELGITLAILAVAVALAIPSLNRAATNGELRDTALTLDAGLATARGEAIRTGDVHLFFLFEDAEGDPLVGPDGKVVPGLIVNDGAPGSEDQNCKVDDGERVIALHDLEAAGKIGAPPAGSGEATLDLGDGDKSTGSSFADPAGNDATWVMFRPEGMPMSFDKDCNLGDAGSGAGSIYMKTEDRAYVVSLSPMGTTTVKAFNETTGAWE